MNVNKFRIPNTWAFLQKGKVWNFQRSIFLVYWWWMQRNGVRK